MKRFLLLMVAAFLLAPAGALAVSSNANAQSNGQSTTTATSTSEAASNQGVAGAIKNCEKTEARVQTKLQSYTTAKQTHTEAYTNLLDRLDKFVTNIQAKGYDTTILEADMLVLEAKISEFKTLVAASYNQLEQTQTYTCGQAEGQFVKSLAQARQKMRLTHQKAAEIRTFYRDVIRVDLQDLKTQNPGAVSSSTSSTGTDADEDTNSGNTTTSQETEE